MSVIALLIIILLTADNQSVSQDFYSGLSGKNYH